MTFDTYKYLAMRSRNTDLSFEMALADGALGLAGESGEVADIIKKVVSQGHPLDDEKWGKIKKELGDVLWYIAEVATLLDMSLDEVAQENIDKLLARYPEGFTTERSLNRVN